MPTTLGIHYKVTAVAVCVMQDAALRGSACPNEAYSCNLCVLDPEWDGTQVASMTSDDWHQTQWADFVLAM